MKGKTT